jgi:hypothetical protein
MKLAGRGWECCRGRLWLYSGLAGLSLSEGKEGVAFFVAGMEAREDVCGTGIVEGGRRGAGMAE